MKKIKFDNMYQKLNHTITYKSKTKTLQEWSEATGIPYATLFTRLRANNTPEEILGKTRIKRGRPKISPIVKR